MEMSIEQKRLSKGESQRMAQEATQFAKNEWRLDCQWRRTVPKLMREKKPTAAVETKKEVVEANPEGEKHVEDLDSLGVD
jgi:hypothetical protein